MKMIEAIIKPFRLDNVKEALSKINVHGMTILEVKGYGRQKGHKEIYRGAEYVIDFVPKILIKLVVESKMLKTVTDTIKEAAFTGKIVRPGSLMPVGTILIFDYSLTLPSGCPSFGVHRLTCRLNQPGINCNTFINGKTLLVELFEKCTVNLSHGFFGNAFSKA